MRPTSIALLSATIPFFAVHITWILSTYNGLIPFCVPYVEGCVTISRAARSGESLHIFRALMLPTSTLLVFYWLIVYQWLMHLRQSTTRGMSIMRGLGTVGALFLILYAVYLGTEGDFYRWMRRYGVTFYFSFTALAQIFFTRALFQLNQHEAISPLRRLINIKMALCITQWAIGLISIPLGLALSGNKEAKDIANNIVEWNFAFAMNAYFFVTYLMLKKTEFQVHFGFRSE